MANTKKRIYKVVTLDGKPFKKSPRNEEIQILLNYLNGLNARGELSALAFSAILRNLDTRIGHHMVTNHASLILTGTLEKLKKEVMEDADQRSIGTTEDGPNAG